MDPTLELDPTKVTRFKEQIAGFLDYSWRVHRYNVWWNAVISVLGTVVSSSVILVGAMSWGLAAAILGAIGSSLFGIQNIFKFAEKANLWELKHNEAKTIRDRLEYKVRTEEDFQALIDDWLVLKKKLLDVMPRAMGFERPKSVDQSAGTAGDARRR